MLYNSFLIIGGDRDSGQSGEPSLQRQRQTALRTETDMDFKGKGRNHVCYSTSQEHIFFLFFAVLKQPDCHHKQSLNALDSAQRTKMWKQVTTNGGYN